MWNPVTNLPAILEYWEQRVRDNGRYENVYTMGMRGIHDNSMPGTGTIAEKRDRLEKIVADILMDMAKRPRLMDGRGNALLVSGSIFQACKLYELFSQTDLKGKCAIVTSYKPSPASIKGED